LLGRVEHGGGGHGAPVAAPPAGMAEKKKFDEGVGGLGAGETQGASSVGFGVKNQPPGEAVVAARGEAAPARKQNGEPTSTNMDVQPSVRITAELTAELERDPLIGAVMRELGGRIVKVE
jgi:hypothetical protein